MGTGSFLVVNMKTTEALSLDDIRSQVRAQVNALVSTTDDMDGPWITDIFLSDAIVEIEGEFFRAPFGNDGATVTVAPRSEWKKVTKEWVVAESARHNKGNHKVKTTFFSEAIDLSEAKLSEDGSRVRVTLIQPGWSKNKRYYSADVLKAAAPLFEGTKAYVDHPTKLDAKQRPERSVRDLAGFYESVKVEDDGRITANLFLEDDAMKAKVKTAVEQNPNYVGLSINALGKTRMGEAEGQKGMLVENIVKANSTDIVTTPAAGGKFEQLLMSGDEFTNDLLEAISLEELRAARPDLIDSLKNEWKTVRDTKALETARDENTTLTEANEALETQLTEKDEQTGRIKTVLAEMHSALESLAWTVQVDRLLAGQKLPTAWQSELRDRLVAVKPDVKKAESIIAAEVDKLKAVRQPVNVTGAGRASTPAKPKLEANPIAEVFGTGALPLDGESPQEYAARIAS